MNRKKLNPSEADLRASILTQIAGKDYPDVEELTQGEWTTVDEMASFMKITYDAADKRLRRRLANGQLETKQEKCLVNGKARLVTFFKACHETS